MVKLRNIHTIATEEIINDLKRIPDQIKKILAKEEEIKGLAHMYMSRSCFLYLARGYDYPVALEGALKLKEISYIPAEGLPAAEMKHGPIALIDSEMPIVFIAPHNASYQKVMTNIEEVKARSGKIIAIATEGDEIINNKVDHVFYIPKTCNSLTPVLSVIPLQLLAYHIAVFCERDVDMPRNLAKSVTVE